MPDEVFWQLRFEPAKWVAEKHVVKVYVGTGGKHQMSFSVGTIRRRYSVGALRPPSLEAAGG